jgi:hypothetical protein
LLWHGGIFGDVPGMHGLHVYRFPVPVVLLSLMPALFISVMYLDLCYEVPRFRDKRLISINLDFFCVSYYWLWVISVGTYLVHYFLCACQISSGVNNFVRHDSFRRPLFITFGLGWCLSRFILYVAKTGCDPRSSVL